MIPVFKSIFPFTGEQIAEYTVMSASEVDDCLTLSSKAFAHWRRTSFECRAGLMQTVADILLKKSDDFARLITYEMGKTFKEAKGEVEKCAGACRYFAENAAMFLQPVNMLSDAANSYVRYDPIGAVLAIMPWNFPFWQVFRFAAPYLMAGNVALLKHAPNVCGVALAIQDIFIEAGFPKGVFQTLIVDVDIIPNIIDHDIVQGITLTGSEFAGSQVGALAGKAIKKSVLELGGSDPLIILEDADMEKAAQVATLSRMQNAGQSCIAAKRFITVGKAKDAFLHQLQLQIAALKQGNPFDENITTGPMARIDLAEKIESQLKGSIANGAILISGGERNGCNVNPALLTHVHKGMPAYDEEAFGPMACIVESKDEADAIAIANDSRYGLGASIWTADIAKAEHMAGEINAGGVFINAMVKSDARYPFGGIKKSGYGRELSSFGIKEFMNLKTVYIS
ncbi:NAD-dependent succinate-semialdehyde dehydrogenase [Limnovirga soli]|uniref:Aldehyde dehydrogenase family protein n=1 Tax=Limnovirga soli TaxID=2656915 RepID=A0A8J8FFT5_9BACT|nr:NAD-dependent succinate-semialdehyde dehydrogenase [Limnovirga soli]NNV57326.1 aldehyde dehydrogenase family protein [Limnovirga soli]